MGLPELQPEKEDEMKQVDIINRYLGVIEDALKEAYDDTLGRPDTQESVYLWEDGEIEYLFGCAGDSNWLRPRQGEDRALYSLWTIKGDDVDADTEEDAEEVKASLKNAFEEWQLPGIMDAIMSQAEEADREAAEEEAARAYYYG